MPKLVKVGFSERDPVNRANELGSGTEVPFRFEVIYDALVYSPYEVEQHVHKRLADARAGKEWFECDWLEAIAAVRSSAADLGELLAEKEYAAVGDYRSEQARKAQELRELEQREQLLLAREAEARRARTRKERIETFAVEPAVEPTRIVLCPKCHATIKTSGKPPPYFCIGCGNKFLAGA
jgi:rubrerythrin